MQKFLLRIQRSVLEEAIVEFDIVGKSCLSLSTLMKRFLVRLILHIVTLHHSPMFSFEIKETLCLIRNGNQN